MAFIRSNPTINRLNRFENVIDENAPVATYGGVALKTLYYVGIVFLAALLTFFLVINYTSIAFIMLGVSVVGALIFGIWASVSPRSAKITGTLYAFFEGVLLGAISLVFIGTGYGEIVFASLLATTLTLAIMMVLYFTGVAKVTQKTRTFVMAALISVIVSNLIFFLIGIFSPAFLNAIYGSWLGIVIPILLILFACFMLLVDIDNIARVVRNGMPKQYEWFAAFGLVVTLIWLYIQFLRLFEALASRN